MKRTQHDGLWHCLLACLIALGVLFTSAEVHAKSDARQPDSKKGIALSTGKHNKDDWREKVASLQVSWHYCWNTSIPAAEPKGVEFVPMIWSYDGTQKSFDKKLRSVMDANRKLGATHLLGFNEPDRDRQANMTVEQALEAWPAMQKTGLRLGSPAAVHADNEWLTQFMQKADERGYRVDFICVHWYGGPNADQFIRHLEKIHKLYNRPIWITEFAVADWQAKTPEQNRHTPATVLAFMKEALPRLDKLDFIERYAWFQGTHDSKALAPSTLFDEHGALTEVGKYYAAHESHR